jgi:hypothetical protein
MTTGAGGVIGPRLGKRSYNGMNGPVKSVDAPRVGYAVTPKYTTQTGM